MLKLRKFNTQNELSDAPEKRRLSPEEKAERKAVRKEKRKRIFRRYILPVLGFGLMVSVLFGVLLTTVSLGMKNTEKEDIRSVSEMAELSVDRPFDCILVLGAGLRPDGSPSDMLHDRVAVGVDLYHALEGVPLLMSGDQTGDYNEVAAMKALAVSLGVPEIDIFLDAKGYSTYESILRAKEIYGARRILIVTQEYHLYRAMYLAEALGVEAYGVSADLRTYRGQFKREAREILARFKDLYQGAKDEQLAVNDPPVSMKKNDANP